MIEGGIAFTSDSHPQADHADCVVVRQDRTGQSARLDVTPQARSARLHPQRPAGRCQIGPGELGHEASRMRAVGVESLPGGG
jgi:hypothetical protein